jgi:methylenetetrahydrofolate reductase (NADPH)
MVIRSAHSARFLREHLPGSRVPDWVIERMERAADAETEGIQIAAELIQELLSVEGVRGVHIMSVGWSKAIPPVIERAGLLPRPLAPEQQGG